MSFTKKIRSKVTFSGDLKLSTPRFSQTFNERFKGLKDAPCDVKLQIGRDQEIVEAHKGILKSEIPYFSAMFSGNFQESSKEVINLPDIESVDAVRKVVDFFYKGLLTVTKQDVQEIFQVCDIWGLDVAKSKCVSFMISELDHSTCIDMYCFGEMYCLEELIRMCQDLISREFQIITKLDSFVETPAQVLMTIVERKDLNLGLQGEDCMVEAVTRWVRHDLSERQEHLDRFAPHLSFSLCSRPVLDDFISICPESVKKEVDERLRLFTWRPDWYPIGVEPRRRQKEHIMVFCGYSHTRSGPTSPRMKTVELFNVETLKSQTFKLPEESSYGTAFNLMGRIIYFAVFVKTDEMTQKQTIRSEVYIFRPEQSSPANVMKTAPEIFSEKAKECLIYCLTHKGRVVYCRVKKLIYMVCVDNVDSINFTFSNGEIFCDYDRQFCNLKAVLSGENYNGMNCVCHEGRLYVIGGTFGPKLEPCFSNQVFKLSEDGTEWEECGQMSMHRTDFAVASYGDQLIVSGGYGGKNSLRRLQNCESFYPTDNCWVKYFSLQQSKSHHCMLVANRELYAIAGKAYASQKLSNSGLWLPGGARIVSSLVEKFDRDSGQWIRLGRLNHARCMFSAITV